MSVFTPRFRKCSVIIVLNIPSANSFSSLSGILIMQILFLYSVLHKSFMLSLLCYSSFGSSDWIISSILSPRSLFSSTWLSLLLKHSIEFFSYQIFNSGIFFFFWIVPISLSNFSFCSCIVFLVVFNCCLCVLVTC